MAIGLLAAPAMAVAAVSPGTAIDTQQSQPVQPPSVDVDVDTADGSWYANPVWIAVGVIALVLIVALVVMAGRGGTTVVK
jgi:hypothetical protein